MPPSSKNPSIPENKLMAISTVAKGDTASAEIGAVLKGEAKVSSCKFHLRTRQSIMMNNLSTIAQEKCSIAAGDFPDYVQGMMREDDDGSCMLGNEYMVSTTI